MAAEEAAERIRENPRLQKARASLGLNIEIIRRLNAQLSLSTSWVKSMGTLPSLGSRGAALSNLAERPR